MSAGSLDALEARLAALACDGDAGPVLDDDALAEAQQVLADRTHVDPGDPLFDVVATRAVALLHWYRYVASDDGGQGDFEAAVALFSKLYQHDPSIVPEPLLPLVDQAEDVDGAEEEESGGGLTWLGLAHDFLARFQSAGSPADLRLGAGLLRTALAADAGTPVEYAALAHQLSATLLTLYERTGVLDAVVSAIDVVRHAVAQLRPSEPEYVVALTDLSFVLLARHHATGSAVDLDEAIAAANTAVASCAPGRTADRAMALTALGTAQWARYRVGGGADALNRAADLLRAATEETPAGSPQSAVALGNLTAVLGALHQMWGDTEVLEEALAVGEAVLREIGPDHFNHSAALANRASLLRAWYARTGDVKALHEAIDTDRRAVELTPADHLRHAGALNGLAVDLRMLFEASGDVPALTEATEHLRRALDATPTDHPSHMVYSNNLSVALRMRFEASGDVPALTEATEHLRRALDATPTDHPDLAGRAANLGTALLLALRRSGDDALHEEAQSCFKVAYTSSMAPARLRVRAARIYGDRALAVGHAEQALDAFEAAIGLLPRLAPRSLSDADRQYGLAPGDGVGADAAAAALTAGRPGHAVELLEQARGILLAEVLDGRSDLSGLRARAPELASEFEHLRMALDNVGDTGGVAAGITEDAQTWSQSRSASRSIERQRLVERWGRLLEVIRDVPGCHDFLKPPTFTELSRQAVEGPVVVLNVSKYRCDALVLTHDSAQPIVVELTTTYDEVTEQADRLIRSGPQAAALEIGSPPSRDARPIRWHAAHEMNEVLAWLWDNITGPVLDALGIDGPPHDGCLPRIWWCPVGPMAALPLHAAGHHQDSGRADARSVLDRAVSSYTPTIRALAHTRRHADTPPPHAPARAPRVLVVGMPETPGIGLLPGVNHEVSVLEALMPGADTLTGAEARRDIVLDALSSHTIAHFACHATSDWNDPTEGRLMLHDEPLTIQQISRSRLDVGELAFLSACETARSSMTLPDESLHLTSAFQLAGYRQVIGTLWPLSDHLAPRVAERIYRFLTDDGATAPQPEHASLALHRTLLELREAYPGMPSLWASFIHVGK
ncbi:CHAT domain-containing protein [Streptomyces sp. NPDC057445]|uniref:CHAT domain-containing protein n=1 Tax=Streptomyces sp. NPDC057445 TaxID=3346136 RepID=UPI0036C807F4